MLPTEEILLTALAEHDAKEGEAVDRSEVISKAFVALDCPGNVSRVVDRTTYIICSVDCLCRFLTTVQASRRH
jgi:hypothetical protein